MVRKEDRGEGRFDTMTLALQMASYTVNITDNKKVFVPEHAKTTEAIVYQARDIYHRTRVANDIRLDSAEHLQERNRLQNQAIAECDHLLTDIQIAKNLFHLRTQRVRYWGGLIENVKKHLRKWRDSDADRFRQMQKQQSKR